MSYIMGRGRTAREAYPLPPRPASDGGVEVLVADDGEQPPISLAVTETILINQTDHQVTWHLPDGTDGLVKEITNGGPTAGPHASVNGAIITSTNSAFGGNDILAMNVGVSVRLVWVTALGGWCAVNVCANVNLVWD